MNIPFDFGETIKNLRKQKGYTQKRLAEVLNVSETAISKYENNVTIPPFETICKIAAWFNVSVDSLVGNDPPYIIRLSGLNDEQIKIIEELVAIYKGNTESKNKICENQKYDLLGRIVKTIFESD